MRLSKVNFGADDFGQLKTIEHSYRFFGKIALSIQMINPPKNSAPLAK
jgi:hypothetical protein